jgi:hypothetical protein
MVARAAFHIVTWSALVVSAQTHDPAQPAAAASAPSPFERRMVDLAPEDQRLYRAVREGIVEAERRRSSTGKWPSAADLAREGVPPFAADPIDRAGYTWTFVQTGAAVNYVGTPSVASNASASSKRETFIAILTEPDPGTAIDPGAVVDEVHHRLADGTMIHATVWMGPPVAPGPAVTVLAPDQGYKQIFGGR